MRSTLGGGSRANLQRDMIEYHGILYSAPPLERDSTHLHLLTGQDGNVWTRVGRHRCC